jgi:acyl carrier protein
LDARSAAASSVYAHSRSVYSVSPLDFYKVGLVVRPLPEILVDIPEAQAGAAAAAAAAAERESTTTTAVGSSRGSMPTKTVTLRSESGSATKGRSLESVLISIRTIAQGLIGNPDLRDDEPLMDAGLDSLSGVELQSSVEGEFGIELSPTAAFDFPTIEALATHVHSEIGGYGGGKP